MSSDEHARPVVPIYECWDDAEAELIRSVLRDAGIESFSSSTMSHKVFPLTAGKMGRVQVLVDEGLEEKAKAAIEAHRQQSDSEEDTASE